MSTEDSGSGSNTPLIVAIIAGIFLLSLNGPLIKSEGSTNLLGKEMEGEEEVQFSERKSHSDITVREERRMSSSQNSDENQGVNRSENRSQDNEEELLVTTLNLSPLGVQDVEYDSVSLRFSVAAPNEQDTTVYVIYGYNEKQVISLATTYNPETRSESNDDRALVRIIDNRAEGIEEYSHRLSSLISDTNYFYKLCALTDSLENPQRTCSKLFRFYTNPQSEDDRFSTPSISVSEAKEIGLEEATFTVRVDMNDGISGIPFLVYGEKREMVEKAEQADDYNDIEEDDEDLMKKRLATGIRGRSEINTTITDLEKRTEYFYLACVEYDGEHDGLTCTSVRSFETDAKDHSDKPLVTTGGVKVSGNTASLSGVAAMGDFRGGLIFVVYGTDSELIGEVEESNRFVNISQRQDLIQKVLVADSGLFGEKKYQKSVTTFLPNEIYYYRFCVEYEDEDEDNRLESVLSCGAVKSFVSGR